ncbi:MAG: DUF5606 domain-containing protein [Flavobacteriales bacterium]|nr:DUF5606 domain-containing protein [Flavobacteriales bacterium]MCX7769095.1 DUF5606 domain-containing protein [Flavobacteriales bacterium]MDW8410447.1 DUF5606 domain-containing protein [Flavobacteriales bacterium]
MGFEKVIYIPGKPGLYRVVNRTSFGLVAESLSDGRRIPVYAHQRVSHLADIYIFTSTEENLPLQDAFLRLAEKTQGNAYDLSGLQNEDHFRAAFEEVVPEYHRQKVYPSDIKKFFTWFNILQAKGLLPENNRDASEKKPNDDLDQNSSEGKTASKKERPSVDHPSPSPTSTKSKGGQKVNTPRKAG